MGLTPVSDIEVDENDIRYAAIQLSAANSKLRSQICYVMIGAGVVTLAVGILLASGLSGDQTAGFSSDLVKIDAHGIGAIILVISAIWGWLAYKTRPTDPSEAKVVAHRLVGHMEGLLKGIKGSVSKDKTATTAINDGLETLKKIDKTLAGL